MLGRQCPNHHCLLFPNVFSKWAFRKTKNLIWEWKYLNGGLLSLRGLHPCIYSQSQEVINSVHLAELFATLRETNFKCDLCTGLSTSCTFTNQLMCKFFISDWPMGIVHGTCYFIAKMRGSCYGRGSSREFL